MGDLAGTLRQRVEQTRRDLSQAREAGDDFSVDTYASQLDDLLRRARAYGVTVEPRDAAEDEPHGGIAGNG
jgi:hypothetical protein